ncbi:MAG TPA: glycosyltransferase family 4 protein [Pseudolabrys sp.]
MVKRLAFAVPGDLSTATGGYAYDRRMIAELEALGWTVERINLGENFPWPDKDTRSAAEARLLIVPEGCPIVVDGLALGALPEAARRLRANHLLIALVHHPLALETGLTPAQTDILRASERAALTSAKHVVVTSQSTANCLSTDYGVPADKITVARPGNDIVPSAPGSNDGIVRVLSVGALVPRKGFDVLVAAFATLADLPWRLTIVGDRGRDPKTAAQLEAEIVRLGLENRVTVTGEVTSQRLGELYAGSDVFALASRFEGYGMAYSEAVAHGLPVVGTRAGAIADTIPPAAALLVAPDDVPALAKALRQVIANADERRHLAAAARMAVRNVPTWQESAQILSRALEALA